MHPNLVLLCAFLKVNFNEIYFLTDQPKHSEIPPEGNTTIFLFFFFLALWLTYSNTPGKIHNKNTKEKLMHHIIINHKSVIKPCTRL